MTALASERARCLAVGEEVADAPLAPDQWDLLEAFVRRERLEGERVAAIEEGRLPATPEQEDLARQILTSTMHRCLGLEALVGLVADQLGALGVRVCVLKGMSTAHLDHHAPWRRSFADADVLVPSGDLSVVYRLLEELGFERRFTEPRPGFDAAFGKGTVFTSPDGRELDVHRTLTMGALGISVDVEELWQHAVPFELAGRRVWALDPEARFVHACLHAAATSDDPMGPTVRDIHRLSRRDPPLDLDMVLRLTRSWRYAAVVLTALDQVDRRLGPGAVPMLQELRSELRPTRFERLTMTAYRDERVGYAGRSLLALPLLRGWRARGAYLRGLAAPDPHYFEDRHASRWGRWRTAVADLGSIWRDRR